MVEKQKYDNRNINLFNIDGHKMILVQFLYLNSLHDSHNVIKIYNTVEDKSFNSSDFIWLEDFKYISVPILSF